MRWIFNLLFPSLLLFGSVHFREYLNKRRVTILFYALNVHTDNKISGI